LIEHLFQNKTIKVRILFFVAYFFQLFVHRTEFERYSGGHITYDIWSTKLNLSIIFVSEILLFISFIKIYTNHFSFKKELKISLIGVFIFIGLSYLYMYFISATMIYRYDGVMRYISFLYLAVISLILSTILLIKTRYLHIKYNTKKLFKYFVYWFLFLFFIAVIDEITVCIFNDCRQNVRYWVSFYELRNSVIPNYPNTKILYVNWMFSGIFSYLLYGFLISLFRDIYIFLKNKLKL
jgi:hypothetical protein